MVLSMTAFAREQQVAAGGTVAWELRTVNHRYLESTFRLPEEFRELETALREATRQVLSRGKLEATLRYNAAEGTQSGLTLNQPLAKSLNKACLELGTYFSNLEAPTPLRVLQWPGMLIMDESKLQAAHEVAMGAFNAALEKLKATRAREGEQLKLSLLQKLEALDAEVKLVEPKLPEVLAAQRARLVKRLDELHTTIDTERLEQELVYLAQKSDVDEEIIRLKTHFIEVRRVLDDVKPIGRRLDFLMQELNREANTLSSKSIDADVTKSAVEMKVLIEQMREQVQNIE